MRMRWRAVRLWLSGVAILGFVLGSHPAVAELRIGDFNIYLNDFDLTVQLVLLEAIPPSFHESLQSGIPLHARIILELWQYNRFWVNNRIETRTVERQIVYNVPAKEYKVLFTAGDPREPYLTKDLREAQRMLSNLRGLKLAPAKALNPNELFYVRARAEVSIGGPNTFFSRLLGQAEETPWLTSSLLTLTRRQ